MFVVETIATKYKYSQTFSFPHLLRKTLAIGPLLYFQGQCKIAEMKKWAKRRRNRVLRKEPEAPGEWKIEWRSEKMRWKKEEKLLAHMGLGEQYRSREF